MRFGVNYTPSNGWFHSWLDFSRAAVARDLHEIKSLGVDHIRVFPLWPLVQPNRTLIRAKAIDDVLAVVDIAGQMELDVNVDALQGHLSSFDFVPSWLESWHRRNMFTDSDVVESTAAYVRELSRALADRKNLLGVTIGNELNQFAHAPHPAPHNLTSAEASHWLATMVGAAREGLADAPRALITVAQYDAAWYDDAQPFGPSHASTQGDMTVSHSWVFNGAAQVHGPLGAGSVRHAEYLMQLAAAWNTAPQRRSWLQEVGAPRNVIPPNDTASFVEETMRYAAAVPNLFGITWWCSHDVSRSLADFPELEYTLGLFTNDGQLKPTGARFAKMIRELSEAPAAAPSAHALVLDDLDPAEKPTLRASCAPGGRFSNAWLDLATATGESPQVVLRSRTGNPSELTARGVRTIHQVPETTTSNSVTVTHPAELP